MLQVSNLGVLNTVAKDNNLVGRTVTHALLKMPAYARTLPVTGTNSGRPHTCSIERSKHTQGSTY